MNSQPSISPSTKPVDRPAAMKPFDDAAHAIATGRWPEPVAKANRPIVTVACNLTPLELIHAAGALPLRLCAGSCGTGAGREAPRDTCQVVKGMPERVAALEEQLDRQVAAIVIPATCEWKARGARLLEPQDRVKVLPIPRDKSPTRVRGRWRELNADLAGFLGERTGTAIRRRALLRSVELYQRAAWLGRRLADLMKSPWPPLAGADLLLAFNMFYSLPVETWIEAAEALLDEIGKSEAESGETRDEPRLLLVGAPVIWPNWWLPKMIEEAGGRIVSDALCSSYRGFSDLVSVDETNKSALIEALADRYLLACTCPCFTPNEEYLWRIENQVRDFRVHGAVLHRLKNCYLFDMEMKRLSEMFKRLDIPVLQVESDYESRPLGALTTRVEAFLDLVRGKQ